MTVHYNIYSLFFALFFLGTSTLPSQVDAQGTQYAQVEIKLDLEKNAFLLSRIGVDLSHGSYRPNKVYRGVLNQQTLESVKAAGFETKVIIEDLEQYYVDHARSTKGEANTRMNDCLEVGETIYEVPENYEMGDYGGFQTFDGMLETLNAMHEMYPDLITEPIPIEGFTSIEERPIYWLRLSDNASIQESDEPQILYTALHHAREPQSMDNLLFYLWYMLENYEDDPTVKYLVDNTDMYFIPCVNPDGYKYNETIFGDGGGLWRKNRRDNGDGIYGVDLNRNYGYEWGIDDEGSSPEPISDVYRGTSGFSEPETQAVKAFCEDHEIQICHNFHTYGNLLIHPWGYNDGPTPDATTFNTMSDILTRRNGYTYGTGTETVGYIVNGDSDDWMYGEQTTKNKIFSFTPEVGSEGFWPSEESIIPFNLDALDINIKTAKLVHNYGELKEENQMPSIYENTGTFDFKLTKHGLGQGPLNVEFISIDDSFANLVGGGDYDLETNQYQDIELSYTINEPAALASGQVKFIAKIDNGQWVMTDTITKVYLSNSPNIILSDNFDSNEYWETSNTNPWGLSNSYSVSAPTCMADSPNGNYNSNQNSSTQLAKPITIYENLESLIVKYYARWNLEIEYDYAMVLLSVDGGTYTPLCTKHTVDGTNPSNGSLDKPIYEGSQDEFVLEIIDIKNHIPDDNQEHTINVKFQLLSDLFVELEGFYFDNFVVEASYGLDPNNADDIRKSNIQVQTYPNPSTGQVTFDIFDNEQKAQTYTLAIFDLLGKQVHTKKLNTTQSNLWNTDSQMPAGVYSYLISNSQNHNHIKSGKIVITK